MSGYEVSFEGNTVGGIGVSSGEPFRRKSHVLYLSKDGMTWPAAYFRSEQDAETVGDLLSLLAAGGLNE